MAGEEDTAGPGGCWIPPDIMRDRQLTMAQKVVFGRVRSLSEQRGFCYAGNDRLALELGISERQVRRHVGSLVSAGYLRRLLERDDSGVVSDRRLYPLNPQAAQPEDASVPTPKDGCVPTPSAAEDGRKTSGPPDVRPEDASVPTPPNPEDASVLQGGDASVLQVGTHVSTKKRGTAVKRYSRKEAGARPREDSDRSSAQERSRAAWAEIREAGPENLQACLRGLADPVATEIMDELGGSEALDDAAGERYGVQAFGNEFRKRYVEIAAGGCCDGAGGELVL